MKARVMNGKTQDQFLIDIHELQQELRVCRREKKEIEKQTTGLREELKGCQEEKRKIFLESIDILQNLQKMHKKPETERVLEDLRRQMTDLKNALSTEKG